MSHSNSFIHRYGQYHLRDSLIRNLSTNDNEENVIFALISTRLTRIRTGSLLAIMCHFCHVLGNNPQAPKHHAPRCKDKSNTFSKIPLKDRTYENGKSILVSQPVVSDSCDSDQHSCVICLDEKSNMTFIPCGHVATCETCSNNVQLCPICRQTIASRLKLFFV